VVTPILAHIGGGEFAPLQLVPAVVAGVFYAVRARGLEHAGRPVASWRQACFFGGLALVAVTLASPLAHVSDELFLAHMAEHLLIGDVAPLLLVLGLTGPLVAPIVRRASFRWLRALAHPLVALPLWAVNLYVWHLPVLYESAVRHAGVHALEHGLFIALGANMWMALFGPLPKPAWFSNAWKLGYIISVRLLGAVLGNILAWSGKQLYPVYAHGEAYWNLTPQQDQNVAGAIMMVEGSILTICLFGWLFLRAAREGEERQDLLDLAGTRGVDLTDARAARAVAAGRGEELRRRIESG